MKYELLNPPHGGFMHKRLLAFPHFQVGIRCFIATSVVGGPGRTVPQGGIPKNKYQRSTLSQKDRENSK